MKFFAEIRKRVRVPVRARTYELLNLTWLIHQTLGLELVVVS